MKRSPDEGSHKQMETWYILAITDTFLDQRRVNVRVQMVKMAPHEDFWKVTPFKNSLVMPSLQFVHIHSLLFWLRKMSLNVQIFQISFHVPFLRRSLQSSVRVFPFLSHILCYPYFSTFLSTCSSLYLCKGSQIITNVLPEQSLNTICNASQTTSLVLLQVEAHSSLQHGHVVQMELPVTHVFIFFLVRLWKQK